MARFPGPNARKILKEADQYYATTTMSSRVIPASGDGAYIYDFDGFCFIDLQCDAGVNNLGMGSSTVDSAIKKQMNTGVKFAEFHNAPHPNGNALAKVLATQSPVKKPAKVFFSNSGSEANTAALKLCEAYRYHRGERQTRKKTIYFENGFAGRPHRVLAATSSKPETQRNPFWDHCDQENSIYLPYPKRACDWYNLRAAFDRIDLSEVDRMLIELPCQGEGGIIPVDAGALFYLYERIKEAGVFFIADCIQCGMGRTGTLFGCDIFPWLEPDILTMAKALGGGLPIGVTIFRADLDWKAGEHSNTFGGGPTVAAAALVALREIEDLITAGKVSAIEVILHDRLKPLCDKKIVVDVRGIGAMWAVEFVSQECAKRVIRVAEEFTSTHECGLRLLSAGEKSVRIMPPLTIGRLTLEYAMELFKKVINTVEQEMTEKGSA